MAPPPDPATRSTADPTPWQPSTPTATSAPTDGGNARATASLVKDVISGTQSLVRQELELAKHELVEGISAKGQAAGMAAAAGMLGLYVLGFLGLAGGAALTLVLPTWAAWLIVAGVFLLVLVVLLLMARSRANSAPLGLVETPKRVKEDLAWAKTLPRR